MQGREMLRGSNVGGLQVLGSAEKLEGVAGSTNFYGRCCPKSSISSLGEAISRHQARVSSVRVFWVTHQCHTAG